MCPRALHVYVVPSALSGLSPQNFCQKNFLKKPALKKFLTFFQKKAFLIFPEMETLTFRPRPPKFFRKKISYTLS